MFPAFLEKLVDGKQCRLGVQGIEDGLDQEQVHAAFVQCTRLIQICFDQFIKGDIARAGIVDIGRDRSGLGRGAKSPCGKSRLPSRGKLRACRPRQFCRGDVHFVRERLHVVVGLRDTLRPEGIGLDDVRPGGQILLVDFLNDLRLRQHQQLVIAFDVMRKICKARAAIGLFVQLVTLDHGAHGAIEHQNTLL